MNLNYGNLSGRTFVFVGQNATTGTPNETTGRMSLYGHYYGFDSKDEALAFSEQQRAPIVEVGSARKLRKYSLGISVADYCEHLYMISD